MFKFEIINMILFIWKKIKTLNIKILWHKYQCEWDSLIWKLFWNKIYFVAYFLTNKLFLLEIRQFPIFKIV